VAMLIAVLMTQLIWLLPLAVLFGTLMPGESDTHTTWSSMSSMHVVVLGGGQGLTRAIALECVRRGADVTVLGPGDAVRNSSRFLSWYFVR
jgi:hypothetical protein